jgi:hypothetical protein
MQHYVMKFVSDFATGRLFSQVSSTNKTDRHDITEILLKVAQNSINPFENKSTFCYQQRHEPFYNVNIPLKHRCQV